jgi:hypothetical protein
MAIIFLGEAWDSAVVPLVGYTATNRLARRGIPATAALAGNLPRIPAAIVYSS